MNPLPTVLFVCTYKGGRSQIAHAYAQKLAADSLQTECACFDPSTISSDFVGFIKTLGLEIKTESPVSVFEKARQRKTYDYIVCMCSDTGTEMCALFRKNIEKAFLRSPNILHWNLPDFNQCQDAPEGFPACAKSICHKIEQLVLELAQTAQENPPASTQPQA